MSGLALVLGGMVAGPGLFAAWEVFGRSSQAPERAGPLDTLPDLSSHEHEADTERGAPVRAWSGPDDDEDTDSFALGAEAEAGALLEE